MVARSGPARFPRSRRLLNGAQFQRVFRRPARSADGCFLVAGRNAHPAAQTDGDSRLGLAISRKALPRAVDRNRTKRIVREAFRQMPWPCPVDVVVVGRTGLRGVSNETIRRTIESHLETIRVRLCAGDPSG